MNIKEGVALCPSCGKLSRLSELTTSNRPIEEILEQPPSGCLITSTGHVVIATVSLRSLAGFVFPAGFALIWNGLTSVFVLQAIAGLHANLIGPLPDWFPAAGLKDGRHEVNGGPMELGMTMYFCVFLIPFVTIGTVIAGIAIMNLIGKVEVIINEFDSYVATVIGFVRWKKTFDPKEVRAVEFGTAAWQSEGMSNRVIEIKSDRIVKFGSMLQSDRMEWLHAVLRKLLLPQNEDRNISTFPKLTWLSRKPL